jgi:hypothetical protein
MKRFSMLLAAGFVALVLAACGSTPDQAPAQIAAEVQAQVAKACAVVQPTLLSLQALTAADPAKQALFAEIVKDNAAVCAGSATIDTASVTSLINSSIPTAIQGVALLPIDAATKTGIQIGLIAFQTALSTAVAQSARRRQLPRRPAEPSYRESVLDAPGNAGRRQQRRRRVAADRAARLSVRRCRPDVHRAGGVPHGPCFGTAPDDRLPAHR